MPSFSFMVSYMPEGPCQAPVDTDVVTKLEHYYTSDPGAQNRVRPASNHKHGQTHWIPKLDMDQTAPTPTTYDQHTSKTHFTNYFDTPSTFGEEPLPPFVYHTACEVGDLIFILGGCAAIHKDYNSRADLSKFVVDKGISLPLPMDSGLINNPAVVPNASLYVVSSVTNRVFKPAMRGDIPPPLLSMSASRIARRYILYYGGFQVVNKVNVENGIYHIGKHMILNNDGYILDVFTHKFRKLALTAHPNTVTRYPITVPRFGHSSTAVFTKTRPADVYVMGGYRQEYGPTTSSFKAIQDIWKLELSISHEGTNDYIEFGDMVLATPVAPMGPVPSARSFHAVSTYKSMIVFHGGTDGQRILGDVWLFDPSNETWKEMETYYEGERAQLKIVGHHTVVLDRFIGILGGATPYNFERSFCSSSDDPIADVSSSYRLKEADAPGSELFYWMWVLKFDAHEWRLEKVCHGNYMPSEGKGNEMPHAGSVGSTVSTENSRTLLIGGQMAMDPNSTPKGERILHSGIGCYEFPLGCGAGPVDTER